MEKDRRRIRRFFNLDLQSRLALGFLIATCLTGLFATVVSIWTINRSTIAELQNRVRMDTNTAKLIYNNKLQRILSLVEFTAQRCDLQKLITQNDIAGLVYFKRLIRPEPGVQPCNDPALLDMLTLVDDRGTVLYRTANPGIKGDSLLDNPLVKQTIEKKTAVCSTELLSIEEILKENPTLLNRATIDIVKTPFSVDITETRLSKGMVMEATYPVIDRNTNEFLGVLIGGVLLNNDNEIVDQIKDTVYHDEKYKGQDIGVATIFQGGVRISTNVMTESNQRAIGTILSKEVYQRVIVEEKDWVGRAFVVKDWYITTYTPIFNVNRKTIGVLYTGILEAKYRDIQKNLIWINLGVTTFGMLIAFGISLYLGNTIIKRIRILKKATDAVAAGDLNYKLSPDTISGFAMLDEAFNHMANSLKEHNNQLQKIHEKLVRTEKITALGEMASGVAHEINNPLGGILLYSNLILEDMPENSPMRENVEKIIYQTNRCKEIVQGLLDFARTPTGDMVPLQINQVIHTSISLVKDQSMFHNIEIVFNLTDHLPDVLGDRSRLEEVFLNLFINAADAMENGGKLTIVTEKGENESIRIAIADTGPGISEEHLDHIFEPFYTTKESGHGTGLGLSIAYGIIRKHNGTIDAESKLGEGTIFIITLPSHSDRKSQAGGESA
ncbi:MAG: cache domain-containing protein [Deltaproteobacteria bacterium]|nr:cache domain-containing protein [Deltaproteobacteria bacterium]